MRNFYINNFHTYTSADLQPTNIILTATVTTVENWEKEKKIVNQNKIYIISNLFVCVYPIHIHMYSNCH